MMTNIMIMMVMNSSFKPVFYVGANGSALWINNNDHDVGNAIAIATLMMIFMLIIITKVKNDYDDDIISLSS